jgi:hypothetical protein
MDVVFSLDSDMDTLPMDISGLSNIIAELDKVIFSEM